MIGETIKNRRNKLGLTQEELVKKAREVYENENLQEEIKVFNQAQLSKWENGEQKPNTKNLWLLSIILETPFFEFTNQEDDNEIIKNFYNAGYCLAKKIQKDISSKIYKLLEYVKNEKMNEVNQEILELYISNNELMPEDIAVMMPIYLANKDYAKEKYVSYIHSFISGLNNGNLKK